MRLQLYPQYIALGILFYPEMKEETRFPETLCGYMSYIEESLFQQPSPFLSGSFSQEMEKWNTVSTDNILLNSSSKRR